MSERPTHVCTHLAADADADYHLWFTGVGRMCWWVCSACVALRPQTPPLVECTDAIHAACEEDAWWDGLVGHPAIASRETSLQFEHTELAIDTRDWRGLQPARAPDGGWWILRADGSLGVLTPATGRITPYVQLAQAAFELDAETDLLISPCERFAAVFQVSGQQATVHAIETGARTALIDRGDYRPENSCFPIAFFSAGDRTLLVAATAWNRLDIHDPATGAVLTERTLGDAASDYFHAGLTVSPDGRRIADAGWVWAPVGIVWTWRLDRWLANPFESESGASRRSVTHRDYYWDGPLCWIDATTLAIWGWGRDDEWLIPAVVIVDVTGTRAERWFPGPQATKPSAWPPKKQAPSMFFDEWLFAVHPEMGVGVWDVRSGEHVCQDASIYPIHYHSSSRVFMSKADDGIVLSRLIGAG